MLVIVPVGTIPEVLRELEAFPIICLIKYRIYRSSNTHSIVLWELKHLKNGNWMIILIV